MQRIVLISTVMLAGGLLFGQEKKVREKIDALRIEWDAEALKLGSYKGLGEFCSQSFYRKKVVTMLDEIHHYDTLLYGIVTRKFADSNDPEAKATIDDIITLEADYTTLSFKKFIHMECNTYNEVERNYGGEKGKAYDKEVGKLEKELVKYVDRITKRIDIIDEHVHHLHIGE
ncbi:MAG: hypothetical protein AAF789_05695 [Bacteroidota bacterium]